jgi:hypothetical protein
LDGLRSGQIDRSGFTRNGNGYFTPEVIGEYADSLKQLGNPKKLAQTRFGMRGGFSERVYRVEFEAKTLTLVIRADSGGKLEQFQLFE